jgi:glutamine amidotransferase
VHSYALSGGRGSELVADAEYGGPVPAVVGRDNLAGTQFHAEKSGSVGLRILSNFLEWRP